MQDQQFQQAPSPYHYQQAPLSVNSSSSYPGSTNMLNTNIGTPTNQQQQHGFTNAPGSVANNSQSFQQQQLNSSQLNLTLNANNQDYSMIVDQSPLLSGNMKNSNLPSNFLNVNSKMSKHVQKTDQVIEVAKMTKPCKLKPLDHMPIINKKTYHKSNMDLKFYVNSLCLSLNLSDTFNNCYRDINFDSCTLCVCNNNYLKGLDYSIYICNDVFNSSVDFYDVTEAEPVVDSHLQQKSKLNRL